MIENEQEILKEVRAGNTRRYAVLVEAHKDRAMTLALRLVGNREEAEELVQDAFVRAHDKLEDFRGDARFGTWLYRILYNLCLTKISRRKSKPEMVDLPDERSLDVILVNDDEISALDQLQDDEIREIVMNEIDMLPGKYKSALLMFYVQEMSYEEMTEALQAPLGTVKTNLFRARSLLRERVLARTHDEVKLP